MSKVRNAAYPNDAYPYETPELTSNAREGIERAVSGILDGYDTGRQGETAIRYLTAQATFNRAKWRLQFAINHANEAFAS